ncbi:hypothetical protein [Chthoniobacter sp.]|uniref:hypothetical protein n=1 Tax=Chthoniobacter sp. TaxID=2510640 RepID=UPI0032AFD711
MFQRGFEPQEADLKLGPLFFKLRALEAAVLHSDNINLTPDNTESGTIAYLGLTLDVVAQFTEDLRLAASFTLVYLPLENRGGIVGFNSGADLFNFGLATGPLTHVQATWDTDIGGWHVVFTDDFQISTGYYSGGIDGNYVLFEGSPFDENLQTRTGRYALGPASGGALRRGDANFDNQLDAGRQSDVIVFSNIISADAERLDPGSILLRARVYHEDLWYNQGNRGLPSLREGATISLISQRENMRFKPYVVYDLFHTKVEDQNLVQNIVRAGFAGPITEQLRLQAELGYFNGGQADSGWLWRVALDHNAGPYTQESLIYARTFNYFHNEINEGVGYTIHQVLGPRLDASAYTYRLRVQDYFDGEQATRDEWLFGLRVTFIAGPKTTVQLTGEYTAEDSGTRQMIGRADIGYNLTDTLLLHLAYQYQESKSDVFDLNFRENLIFLSVTKYFR